MPQSKEASLGLQGSPKKTPFVEAPSVSPRQVIEDTFREALSKYARVKQTTSWGRLPEEQGFVRCQEALALLDGAIKRLGVRTGKREDAARAYLDQTRSAIASAVEAFHGFGADFSRPVAQSLINRVGSVRAARAAAEHAVAEASRETLAAAKHDLELIGLSERDLNRAIARALASLGFPHLPNAQNFVLAERDCIDLEAKAGKRPKCRDIHAALEAGMRRELDVAQLWPIYETQPEHELVKWRARAFEERS